MSSTEPLLSPKDLAAAIGASESSLRRWIDSGDIRISRTAGGHRRVPLSEAVRFIRTMGAVVVRPEVLNLPALAPPAPEGADGGDAAEGQLFAALREGQREMALGLVVSWYLRGQSLHALFDGPVRAAMHRVGELWQHDERGILIEHRATDICVCMINAMRPLLPAAEADAPLAIGGAPGGDPYQVPSLMAGAVLAEAGLRDANFGPHTPVELLAAEAVRRDARLVWLSVSAAQDAAPLRKSLRAAAATLEGRNIELVIGGHASGAVASRGGVPHAHVIRSMGELSAFARGMLARSAARTA
jgi:excisionase family DNA binding protein